MEKEGIFYKRESLSSDGVVRLIRLWECEVGESFTDYCNFSRKTTHSFINFLNYNFPVLCTYCDENTDKFNSDIQELFQCCVEYCTSWIPEERVYLWDAQYNLVYQILAEFILNNDTAWENFVYFFTNTDNNVNPYIDGIREDFEKF